MGKQFANKVVLFPKIHSQGNIFRILTDVFMLCLQCASKLISTALSIRCGYKQSQQLSLFLKYHGG